MLPQRWPARLRRTVAWILLIIVAVVLLTAMFGPMLSHI